MLIKNIHIRFEDDVLFPGHSSGLIWDSLIIRPSNSFWEFHWPTNEDPGELRLGPFKRFHHMRSRNESVSEPMRCPGSLALSDAGDSTDSETGFYPILMNTEKAKG